MTSIKENLLRTIDRATEPAGMSKDDALDLLDQLRDDIAARIECLREEIANEAEGE